MTQSRAFPAELVAGVIATTVVIAAALAIASLYDPATFTSWGAFIWMTAVPAQLIFALVWSFNYPAAVGAMRQPAKGLAYAAMTLPAMLLGGLFLYWVPGQGLGPTPFLIMQTICVVIATFWIVIVWRVWPVSLVVKHPLGVALGAFVLSYGLGLLVFRLFFDFSFMAGAPVYVAALDPGGMFNAWLALAFVVGTGAIIMVMALFDFWPFTDMPKAGTAPVFGVYVTVATVVLTGALTWLFVGLLSMDPVDFMVRVPVSIIFGVFLTTTMMRSSLFAGATRPVRGLLLLVLTVVAAVAMDALYRAVAPLVAGEPLPAGPPGYSLELWVATAMLAFTFPLINLLAGYFGFWPLVRGPAPAAAPAQPADAAD